MEAAQVEPALLGRNRQLRIERDEAREQRRRWQEASAADRMENVKLRASIRALIEVYAPSDRKAVLLRQHLGE